MDSSDIVAIIGSIAAAITLIINTWFSVQAKTISQETKDVAVASKEVADDTNVMTKRHEEKTEAIQATVETIAENLPTSES